MRKREQRKGGREHDTEGGDSQGRVRGDIKKPRLFTWGVKRSFKKGGGRKPACGGIGKE